ncbi:MAG: hypothetical protein AB7U73_22325 [Pirellulales bacterium]
MIVLLSMIFAIVIATLVADRVFRTFQNSDRPAQRRENSQTKDAGRRR